MIFDQTVIEAVSAHAGRCAPMEACGVVVEGAGSQRYVPCRNIATDTGRFTIDPDDYARVEDEYRILGIAHSHVGVPPTPSQADVVGCESSALPWLIVNWPIGNYYVVEPSGAEIPLLGREFCYGTLDCFALVRDYYRSRLNILIPDFQRPDDWNQCEISPVIDNLSAAGFDLVPVDRLHMHDVLLMKCGTKVINHLAIFTGGVSLIQHLRDRLSGVGVYDGYWRKVTVAAARHRSLM